MMNFSISNGKVLLDGKETQILSGAIHYFRTLPEQWENRLLKLKHCGFNTVETYIAWHLHEEKEGVFDFSGNLDFVRFIELAGSLGLHVIVRPGPFICSECDFGGMPGWLLGKPNIRLRCSNEQFLTSVKNFFDSALPLLVPLQCTHGGPIIAVQVENEYGSYGSDKKYLRTLCGFLRENEIDVQLFTSDGIDGLMLACGTLPELPATVNHRNNPEFILNSLAKCDTGYPNARFIMELWVGKAWHWGVQPQHHNELSVAQDVRDILENGGSVNCYMFHGGTNFGFTSGANCFNGTYMPLLTSYEVDALLDEAGNPTPKYYAVQKVMEELRPGTTDLESANSSTAYPAITCTEYVSLEESLKQLSSPVNMPLPETMEYFGQSFGFIHYSTFVDPVHTGIYRLENMRHRAIVMLNGKTLATISCNDKNQEFYLIVTEPESRLEILVENTGRVNFGHTMESQRCGLTGVAGIQKLMNWEIRSLPLKDWSKLQFKSGISLSAAPGFYKAELVLNDKPQDTFLKFPEGVRGYVQVNGFNIGRYWTIGPQRTLYIPSPLLKKGKNEIFVFELHGLRSADLSFSDKRILDPMAEMILDNKKGEI